MRLRQVLVGAAPGDAVTQIAQSIRSTVGPALGGEIYAVHRDPGVPDVRPIEDLPPPGSADDLMLYHLSIGHPHLADLMQHRPERLVVHYHNITPARLFDEIDPGFAALLRCGRTEMARLAGRSVAVVADSQFNAIEIGPHTPGPVVVVPPPIRFDRFTRTEPHPPTLNHFEAAVDHPTVLVLGQVLPHKRPEVAVAAAYLLRAHLGVDAHLVIAGPQRNHTYAEQVARYIEHLGLDNVWLAGALPEDQLAAVLRHTSILLQPSVHEGFCVPIVEAFHLGIPVIARSAGAIPETVGDGGVLLPELAGPSLFAEAIARVLTDDDLRQELGHRSSANAARFGPESIGPLVELLTELAR